MRALVVLAQAAFVAAYMIGMFYLFLAIAIMLDIPVTS